MITDEDIEAIEESCKYSPDGKRFVIDKRQRDRAIYQLGRQHQRESDAELCESLADNTCYDVASDALIRASEAIQDNTGEK